MAYSDLAWYAHAGDGSTTGYYAVPKWAASTSTPPGTLRRQLTAPAAGSERVFVATQATTQNTGSTEPTWVITRGGRPAIDGAVQWQECTGASFLNGDTVNHPTWAQTRAVNVNVSIGQIIKRNSGASFHIATVGGNVGASEPSFSDFVGTSIVDSQVTWVCIGLASAPPAAWSAPHARLVNAVQGTWGAVGNDFFVADNSNEQSTTAINVSLGSTTAPCRYFSVDRNAPGTLKAGASITSSAASASAMLIGGTGSLSMYWYGFTFISTGAIGAVGITISANIANTNKFENCSFQLAGAATATQFIGIGSTGTGGAYTELINCTFSFNNVGQLVSFGAGNFVWRNTADPILVSGSAVPTTFMRAVAAAPATLLCEGIDFTALGANILVFNGNSGISFTFKNCKLHAGVLMSAPVAAMVNLTMDVVNCDSTTKVYRNERWHTLGVQTTSTAVFRTGGAVDGGQAVSHLIIPTSFVRPWRPFNCLPLVIWNDVIGVPRTLTLYGALNGTAVLPFNDQAWIDVEYMGSTLTPIASLASNGLANIFATHVVVSADASSVWTGLSGTNAPFALAVTFTPQQKGYVTVYPRLAGVLTFYLDPKPVLT